ncbi:hypothetical protein [Clostridium folliculivorans]|uniref:Bacterial Pleckstrin homology domain-containing protein n=1 Tax=Clostridium folliculivorans TaxID=2886038 RepID=A0A9W5Y1S8_9CLOT|nr:hypothetical protein [Clostridium folliculivorans]GKU24922.1 hypothetical protein CFOLD11_17480 [Clostridium folliculivorans]GKU31020.1 hypothetical protein CFB3_31270 [Clostridium folliculivorans]
MNNMFFIVILFIQILFLVSTLYSLKTALKADDNIILGVTLPKDKLNDEQVEKLELLYIKNINTLAIVFGLLFVPELLLKIDFAGYPSLEIVYFFAWITSLLISSRRVVHLANKRMRLLKSKNKWGVSGVKTIDINSKKLTYDDEFWPNGINYCNPKDKSFIVSKRIGLGNTVNLGIKKGKIFTFGTLAAVITIAMVLSTYLLLTDFYTPSIYIDGDKIKVSDLDYSTAFNTSEIQDVKLIDEVPKVNKINGALTSIYARGKFDINSYGAGRIFIFKNSSPYIMIRLKDSYIIYNEDNKTKTNSLYEELKARVK